MSISAPDLAEQLRRLLPRPEPVVRVDEAVSGATPGAEPVLAAAAVPAAAVPPVAPAGPVGPCRLVDHAAKGFELDVQALPDEVVAVARLLDARGFALDAVTGVDWIAMGEMEVVYDYFHPLSGLRLAVRARVPRAAPEIPTIQGVFPGANWHERETHDFFGIRFLGHPNLTPLLLPEDAEYHPLRKDFTA